MLAPSWLLRTCVPDERLLWSRSGCRSRWQGVGAHPWPGLKRWALSRQTSCSVLESPTSCTGTHRVRRVQGARVCAWRWCASDTARPPGAWTGAGSPAGSSCRPAPRGGAHQGSPLGEAAAHAPVTRAAVPQPASPPAGWAWHGRAHSGATGWRALPVPAAQSGGVPCPRTGVAPACWACCMRDLRTGPLPVQDRSLARSLARPRLPAAGRREPWDLRRCPASAPSAAGSSSSCSRSTSGCAPRPDLPCGHLPCGPRAQDLGPLRHWGALTAAPPRRTRSWRGRTPR